ncbi:MAG: Hpt domain-containing protein [Phycisphaerales bacterium]|nr:Hpt domain-containing protein [Phycisphaerales bacterium]
MPSSIRTAYKPAAGSHDARANSVRLDLVRLCKLFDLLDAREDQGKVTRRTSVRWPFRHVCLPLTIIQIDGSRTSISVACRNLSGGGLSVLHSAYVHSGSTCHISLPRRSGPAAIVSGTIARCVHLSGVVHEVGIKFSSELNIADFIDLGPKAEIRSVKRVDPASLSGNLVIAGASEMESQLVRFHLRETGLTISTATTPDQIRAALMRDRSLLLLSAAMDFSVEPSLTERLRSSEVRAPIVILSPDDGVASIHPSTRLKADAVLTTPVEEKSLLRVITGLMRETGRGVFLSSLPADHPSQCLVPSFVHEVRRQARQLESALRTAEKEACMAVCRQIAGIAPMVGFDGMSAIARRAESTLASAGRVDAAANDLHQLLTACLRARAAA